jgi:glycosyltransferase involved in cell wall biosynthesis
MKIFIQTKKFKGGPASFRGRLIKYLNGKDGVEVISDFDKKFDIELCLIRRIFRHKKPYVLRADGCYYINLLNNNPILASAINQSNFTVYQSEFSRQMCQDILGVNKKSKVIYNGIDQSYVESIEPDETIIPGSFVTSAGSWRDNKRPRSTFNGFLEAATGRHLYVLGGNVDKFKVKSQYVHFVGMKSEKDSISIMKACDYQLHLCHIDSCPNAVVEGLSSGLNVLCANLGGTKELVKDNGVVLEVDKWKRRKMKKRVLDSLDVKIVAKGIHNLMEKKERSIRPDLDISYAAERYLKVLRKNLDKV